MESASIAAASNENSAQVILQVAKAIVAHLELPDVLGALIATLKPMVHFDAVGIGIREGEAVRLHSLHIEGFPRLPGESVESLHARFAPGDDEPLKFLVSEHPISRVTASGQPYVASDLKVQTHFDADRRLLDNGFRSYVCIPMIKQDEVIGAIDFVSRSPRNYTAEQVQSLSSVADMVSIAVANALAYEEIKKLKEQLQLENRLLQDEIVRSNYQEIVGSSTSLQKVLASIEKVARTDSTVLINGETGTGKELIAHAIHRRSPRADRALIKVNCAALPKELVASELFGHEKGAFTGAIQQRIGRFEAANGGTIFLDEIGELSPEIQIAFLRVLQEREFERVGGNKTIRTDTRVITATNRDLQLEVAEGRFRMDLYYRLNVFPIHIPPLRDRPDDIPILVDYFAARLSARMGKRIRQVEKRSLEAMQQYSWPGNIRELQNILERCVILAEGEVLRLDPGMLVAEAPRNSSARPSGQKAEIEAALRETRGRVSGPDGAAGRLGVPASTLESRIRALNIDKRSFR